MVHLVSYFIEMYFIILNDEKPLQRTENRVSTKSNLFYAIFQKEL